MTATIEAKPIKLILEDGSEWNFSPLTDAQWSELDTWAQANVIRSARVAAEGLTARERGEILQAAARAASEVQWSDVSSTREAQVIMLWHSLQNCHPDVKISDCVTILKPKYNQRELLRAFLFVNYGKKIESDAGGRRELDPQRNGA